MCQIIFDIEIIGLNVCMGDCFIEIGCVELLNWWFIGNNLYFYVNFECDSDLGVLVVYGFMIEFLSDKLKFVEVVYQIFDFVKDVELIIYNVLFDLGFFDVEFVWFGLLLFIEYCGGVIDMLVQVKQMFFGKCNLFDVLCDCFGISNVYCMLYGVLFDLELFVEVYFVMMCGQDSFVIDMFDDVSVDGGVVNGKCVLFVVFDLFVVVVSDDELVVYQVQFDEFDKLVKGICVWCQFVDMDIVEVV